MPISGNKTRDFNLSMPLRIFNAWPERGQFCELEANPRDTLAQAIWLSGKFKAPPLCAGIGLCGLCAVRFLGPCPAPCKEEAALLSKEKLNDGWRLACRHTIADCMRHCDIIEVEPAYGQGNCLADAFPTAPAEQREFIGSAVLGIDFGTTAVQWRAIDGSGSCKDCVILAEGGMRNPQAGAGADVISRLGFAARPGGAKRLARLAREAVMDIIQEIADAGREVTRICLAANSAMTEIFLEKDISGLCKAPYSLSFSGSTTISLPQETGRKIPPVVIPPLLSPFIGGDISAGLLWLLENETPRPFLLADLGTNAELALLDASDRLYLTSVPLGPALEGIGPACGQPAGPGIVTAFRLTIQGVEPLLWNNAGMGAASTCGGISATGYLSLLALLLNMGIMNDSGQFARPEDLVMPLAKKIAAKISRDSKGASLALPLGQRLVSNDVEMLLKVKAAFSLALKKLVQAAETGPDQIARLCLAGSIGEHVNIADLENLGFIPSILAEKTQPVGNASLKGACILAREPAKLKTVSGLCAQAGLLQLADDPDFLREYMAAMKWGGNA